MKHTFRKLIAALCCMAIVMTMLPAMASATSQLCDWTFFSEDFESYDVGENALYVARPNHFFYPSYITNGSCKVDIDEDESGRFLKYRALGSNQLRVATEISGETTYCFDFCPLTAYNSKFSLQLKTTTSPATPFCTVGLCDSGKASITLDNNKATVSGFMFAKDKWYTVECSVGKSEASISVRERGADPATAKTATSRANSDVTMIDGAYYVYFTSAQNAAYGIDNLTITKKISVTNIPTEITGSAFEHQQLAVPTFSEGKPALTKYRWASADETIALTAGDSVYFVGEGDTDLSLWLCDVCGNPTSTAATIPVTVSEGVGNGDYPFFCEDFSTYTVGENTFKSANSDHYTCTATKTVDTLDIRDDGDGDKYLQLCVHGPKQTTVNEIVTFTLKDKVSGAYSIEWDYRSAGNKVPYNDGERIETDGIMVEVAPGIEVRHAVHGLSYVYVTTSSGLLDNKSIGNIYNNYTPGQWYHVRTDVVPGKIVVTVYERGNNTPVKTSECSLDGITTEYLAKLHNVKFTVGPMGIYPSDVVYKIGIDNIRMIRPDYDRYLPAGIEMNVEDDVSIPLLQDYPHGLVSVHSSRNTVSIINSNRIVADRTGEDVLLIEGRNALNNEVTAFYPMKVKVTENSAKNLSVSADKLTFAKGGTTQKINVTVPDAIESTYPGYLLFYVTLDDAVASVAANGTVSANADGKTNIMVFLLDAEGSKTEYWTKVTVAVGKQQLKVLSIGNSYSRDSLHYLSRLAKMAGEDIYPAYLYTGSCTLRMHANAAMYNVPIYTYYTSNDTATTKENYFNGLKSKTMAYALADEEWDVITIQQGVTYSGMEGTYSGADLDFLLDYIKETNPQAKIYWNMTWALRSNSKHESFDSVFDGDPSAQYNAIIDSINQYIKTDSRIDGVIKTGYAIQLARAIPALNTDVDNKDLLREAGTGGLHLAYNRGRLIAGMTWLKTLCPDADLSLITSSGVTTMFNNGAGESNSASYQDACTAMTDSMLNDVRTCVTTAVNTEPQKLAYTNKNTVASNVATTILQAPAPYKLHFPDTTTMDDGTLFVTAYKNTKHQPTPYSETDYNPMVLTEENPNACVKHYADNGAGKLVLYRSIDNGENWSEEGSDGKPLLVIDQKQLADWGIADLYGSYGRLRKAGKLPLDANTIVPIYIDPRDGNIMSVHTDVDGDGVKENLLTYTFWVRIFYQNATTASKGDYLITSLDGGNTWTEPVKLDHIKRGDLTEFADGEILVPEYGGNTSYSERLEWVNGNWSSVQKTTIAGDPSYPCTEPSFFAPEGGNTVYALMRESGWVYRSINKGDSWTKIADEDDCSATLRDNGNVEQPSFCYIDGFRTFTVYSNDVKSSNRPIYGGMIYFDDEGGDYGWADSGRQLIYSSPNTAPHDTGDPHCTYIPAKNKVLVVSYDTEYRSIVGNYLDISDSKYLPTVQKLYVQKTADVEVGESVKLNAFAASSGGITNITWSATPKGYVTVASDGTLNALHNGSTVTVTADAGGLSKKCTVTIHGAELTYRKNSAHSVTVSANYADYADGKTMAVGFYNDHEQLVKWQTATIVEDEAEVTATDEDLDFSALECKVFFFDAAWKPLTSVKFPKN